LLSDVEFLRTDSGSVGDGDTNILQTVAEFSNLKLH